MCCCSSRPCPCCPSCASVSRRQPRCFRRPSKRIVCAAPRLRPAHGARVPTSRPLHLAGVALGLAEAQDGVSGGRLPPCARGRHADPVRWGEAVYGAQYHRWHRPLKGRSLVTLRRGARPLWSEGLAWPRAPTARASWVQRTTQRDGGLPRWLTSAVGGMLGVGPEDGLKPMCGAQGLLIQGLGERSEDAVVAVELPPFNGPFASWNFATGTCSRRASVPWCCIWPRAARSTATWSPLLPRTMLQDVSSCLWELYGLTWPSGDRAAVFLLRCTARQKVVVAPHWRRLAEWRQQQVTRGWIARCERETAVVRERYAALTQHGVRVKVCGAHELRFLYEVCVRSVMVSLCLRPTTLRREHHWQTGRWPVMITTARCSDSWDHCCRTACRRFLRRFRRWWGERRHTPVSRLLRCRTWTEKTGRVSWRRWADQLMSPALVWQSPVLVARVARWQARVRKLAIGSPGVNGTWIGSRLMASLRAAVSPHMASPCRLQRTCLSETQDLHDPWGCRGSARTPNGRCRRRTPASSTARWWLWTRTKTKLELSGFKLSWRGPSGPCWWPCGRRGRAA